MLVLKSVNAAWFWRVPIFCSFPGKVYMAASLNGGTPKTPQNDGF